MSLQNTWVKLVINEVIPSIFEPVIDCYAFVSVVYCEAKRQVGYVVSLHAAGR